MDFLKMYIIFNMLVAKYQPIHFTLGWVRSWYQIIYEGVLGVKGRGLHGTYHHRNGSR